MRISSSYSLQVTCLVLFYLSVSFENWRGVILYALAWAEWPLMLFGALRLELKCKVNASRMAKRPAKHGESR